MFVLLLNSIYFLKYDEPMSFDVIWFSKHIALATVIQFFAVIGFLFGFGIECAADW